MAGETSSDDVFTASQEAYAARARVVGEVVEAELTDAIESFFQQLDDVLGADGLVSDQAVACALAPYGLAQAWLNQWCGRPAPYVLVSDEAASLLDRSERN